MYVRVLLCLLSKGERCGTMILSISTSNRARLILHLDSLLPQLLLLHRPHLIVPLPSHTREK